MRIFKESLVIDESAEDLLRERSDIMREHYLHDIDLLAGFINVYEEQDLKFAIASGSQKEFVNIIINRFALKKIRSCVSGEEVSCGKPAPDIYIKAAELLGVDPHSCIVLEDAANGIDAAKAAGCYAIAVPTEYTRGQDFSNAEYVAKDLFDANEHIKKLL
jgi:HAD superfamily hydrolase (TIGR01509 family)